MKRNKYTGIRILSVLGIVVSAFLQMSCEGNNTGVEQYIPIERIVLDAESMDMILGEQRSLSFTVIPENYTDSLLFMSDSESVTVDENGLVTAISAGAATVKIISGDYSVTAQCTVNVTDDYVDEYGINHGPGTEINGVVWAPVNCGFHAQDFPYGKLYQWGRIDGQGYSDDGILGKADAEEPEIVLTLEYGEEPESNVFYTSLPNNQYENCYNQWMWVDDDGNPAFDSFTTWGNLKELERFADNDGIGNPCPKGWRVPTLEDWRTLRNDKNQYVFKHIANRGGNTPMGQSGKWVGSNCETATAADPDGCIFLPNVGERTSYGAGHTRGREVVGNYWTATPDEYAAFAIYSDNIMREIPLALAYGYAVRCVLDKTN